MDELSDWDPMAERKELEKVLSMGIELKPGDRVRLCPKGRADIFDIALTGKIATIAAIEQDFENRIHLAVTIDDDPGADLGRDGKIGHRFFFSVDDVELADDNREGAMNPPRILIAGIGNIFLGDDAFGVEVAQRLLRRSFPADVRIVDFGIRGIDLFYTLQEGCETAILVDAVQRGQAPGTLYLIEPDPIPAGQLAPEELMIQGHSLDPMRVLQLAGAMSDRVKRVLLVGCEPGVVGSDEEPFPLVMSEPVQATVDQAVLSIESLVEQILNGNTESLTLSPPLVANTKEAHPW